MVIFYSYVKLPEGTQLKPWRMNIEWTMWFLATDIWPKHTQTIRSGFMLQLRFPSDVLLLDPGSICSAGKRFQSASIGADANRIYRSSLLVNIQKAMERSDANRIYRSKWEIACKHEAFENSSTWWAMPTRCQSLPWSPKNQTYMYITYITRYMFGWWRYNI